MDRCQGGFEDLSVNATSARWIRWVESQETRGERWKEKEGKAAMMIIPGRMDSFVVGRCRKEDLCGLGDPSRECAAGARRGCREVTRMSVRPV